MEELVLYLCVVQTAMLLFSLIRFVLPYFRKNRQRKDKR